MSLHLKRVPFKQVYARTVKDENTKNVQSRACARPNRSHDGIDLETLVNKRTSSMMQPQQAAKIEKATRKQLPDGIPGYGTDALRYTFYSLASTGRDIKFDLGRMEGFRNFCNKLWNAARFVLMNTEGFDPVAPGRHSEADEWILSRLQTTIIDTSSSIEHYRFDHAAKTLYDLGTVAIVSGTSKPVLWDDTSSNELGKAPFEHYWKCWKLSRLMHPLMPFITEEICRMWPRLGISGDTICSPLTEPTMS